MHRECDGLPAVPASLPVSPIEDLPGEYANHAKNGAGVRQSSSVRCLDLREQTGDFSDEDEFLCESVEELLHQASSRHTREIAALRSEIARLQAALSSSIDERDLPVTPRSTTCVSGGDNRRLSPPHEAAAGTAHHNVGYDHIRSLDVSNQQTSLDERATPQGSGREDGQGSVEKVKTGRKVARNLSIMRHESVMDPVQRQLSFSPMDWLDRLVRHWGFEVFFVALIMFSSLILAFEAEYEGYQSGFRAEFPGSFGQSAEESWPNAPLVFDVLEYTIGVLFAIEVFLKLLVYKRSFFSRFWNDFDLSIVALWVFEKVDTVIPLPALVLRLARLVKILRLIRLTRTLEFVDTLNLIVVALKASLSATVWSLLLLSVIALVCALGLNYGTKAYVESRSIHEDDRLHIYKLFGTFWRSFLSVIELTIGNWVPITRDMQEYLSPWCAVGAVCYRLIMEIAVLKVVTGVFLHETFRVAKSDSELMIRGKMREDKLFCQKMESLFAEIDVDGSGTLSKDEFYTILVNPRAKLYLGALGLHYHDTESLWGLLMEEVNRDPNENSITEKELENAVRRIRGEGRSIDIMTAVRRIGHLQQQLEEAGVIKQRCQHRHECSDNRSNLEKKLIASHHDGMNACNLNVPAQIQHGKNQKLKMGRNCSVDILRSADDEGRRRMFV